jgi:hypothetical protein
MAADHSSLSAPFLPLPQRAGDAGQESPVEIHHAQEVLQLLDDGGAGKLLDGGHV